jgi:hypothetical protein
MDISHIKSYLTEVLNKIINEEINIKNFIFSKEVKIGSYSGITLAYLIKKMGHCLLEPLYLKN